MLCYYELGDLASKLSQSGIPQSSRSTIINSIIKHIVDSGESEYKGNTNNTNNSRATGDVAGTVADTDKDVNQHYQILAS